VLLVQRANPPDAGKWGFPGGVQDLGETVFQTAMRELREETGYEAIRWLPLGRFVVEGNRGCGVAHLFLAEFAQQVAEPDGKDRAEVSVELISVAEFLKALENGGSAKLATAAAVGLAIATEPG
jgi:ADP-ribose pyrophosphatase